MALQAKDLMIGDLVKVTRGNLTGRVVDINSSRDFVGYCNIDAEERYLEAAYMKYIEPIPLTEEILKANGFKESSMGLVLFPRGRFGEDGGEIVDFINVLLRKDKTIRGIEISVFHYHFQCNYYTFNVHQFQHALRLCGLTDLADNFKIE